MLNWDSANDRSSSFYSSEPDTSPDFSPPHSAPGTSRNTNDGHVASHFHPHPQRQSATAGHKSLPSHWKPIKDTGGGHRASLPKLASARGDHGKDETEKKHSIRRSNSIADVALRTAPSAITDSLLYQMSQAKLHLSRQFGNRPCVIQWHLLAMLR